MGAIVLFMGSVLLIPSKPLPLKNQSSDYIVNLSTAAIQDGHFIFPLATKHLMCGEEKLSRLALSIAIVENYFRGNIRRKVEILYAQFVLAFEDKLPAISLGLTQLGPEAARNGLTNLVSNNTMPPISDHELFQLIIADHSNLILAYGYLDHLKTKLFISQLNQDTIKQLAQRYNSKTSNMQSNLYALMVYHIYQHQALIGRVTPKQCDYALEL